MDLSSDDADQSVGPPLSLTNSYIPPPNKPKQTPKKSPKKSPKKKVKPHSPIQKKNPAIQKKMKMSPLPKKIAKKLSRKRERNDSDSDSTSTTTRAPNWSEEEIAALASEAGKYARIFQSRLTPTITKSYKDGKWVLVARVVNAVTAGKNDRSWRKCKKKWQKISQEISEYNVGLLEEEM